MKSALLSEKRSVLVVRTSDEESVGRVQEERASDDQLTVNFLTLHSYRGFARA